MPLVPSADVDHASAPGVGAGRPLSVAGINRLRHDDPALQPLYSVSERPRLTRRVAANDNTFEDADTWCDQVGEALAEVSPLPCWLHLQRRQVEAAPPRWHWPEHTALRQRVAANDHTVANVHNHANVELAALLSGPRRFVDIGIVVTSVLTWSLAVIRRLSAVCSGQCHRGGPICT